MGGKFFDDPQLRRAGQVARADALSFTLNVGGIDLITHAGTYHYSSDFAVP